LSKSRPFLLGQKQGKNGAGKTPLPGRPVRRVQADIAVGRVIARAKENTPKWSECGGTTQADMAYNQKALENPELCLILWNDKIHRPRLFIDLEFKG
jgi:hypothetical protein